MAGTVVRIGRYRSSSGPDLALVYDEQQLASFTSPASHSSRLILYRAGAWIGKYSGNPKARLGLLYADPDGSTPNNLRPGGVAVYSGEMVPSTGYTGGGGGQQMFANLTSPFVTSPNYAYTIAITNSTGVLGTAMYQASAISEPNEWFFRRSITGNIPRSGHGSTTSNEGQLVGWFEGEENAAPYAPTNLSPSGSNLSISRTPTLLATFDDPNRILNNGVAYDQLTSTEVEVRVGNVSGTRVYHRSWNNGTTERNNRRSSTTSSTLNYGTTYYYRVRHKDRIGLWGPWASTTFSIKDPNDPPHSPDYLTPSGNIVASNTTPSLRFRHRDPNGHSANRAYVEVQTSGGTNRWTYDWAVSAGNNTYITRTYAGTALAYGTSYRWRARTRDTGGKIGAWSSWVYFSITPANTKPHPPDQISPSGNITGGLAPTLSMRHRDPDGDSTSNVTMQVRRVADGTYMLNKTWAVSIAHNGKSNRVYDGATLSYNTAYQFRGRTQDSKGAWGNYSAWTNFTITSLSSVAKPTSPSGWQAGQIPADVVATYTHNSGVSSQAFRARLLNSNGAVIATSGWVNKTIANGNNVTLTWSELGWGARAWGANEQVQLQARDANGEESPSWSDAVQFNINAAPTVPSGLSPSSGSYSSRPLLIVQNVTDADTVQHPKSSLIVKVEMDTGSSFTITRTMSWVAARNRWEYQTTEVDLPTQRSYLNTWQAYAGDGIVWSGGTTVEANASKSVVANFRYDAVPSVTITGPASPIETTQPTITWDVDLAQQIYRVYGYMGGTLVYDSELVVSGSTSHQIVPGNFLDGEVWNTGETIDFEIESTSTSYLTGTSPRVSILLEYTPPATLELSGEAFALPQTSQINAIRLWHEPTTVANEDFEGYIWTRVEVDDQGIDVPGTKVTLAFITNAGVTGIVDATVESHKSYRWTVIVRERRDYDIVPSDPAIYEGSVQWDGIVVHAVDSPMNSAVELAWSGPDADYDPSYHWSRSSEQYETVSGERVFSIGKKMHKDASGTFEIMDDEYATAEERLATLDYLYKLQGGEIDGEPHTALWRSGRGGVNGLIYGVLRMDPDITWDQDGWYILDIGIQAASYTLGVEVEDVE